MDGDLVRGIVRVLFAWGIVCAILGIQNNVLPVWILGAVLIGVGSFGFEK